MNQFAAAKAARVEFSSSALNANVHFRHVLRWSMGPPRIDPCLMSGFLYRRVPHWCNGKSLRGMGLIRERWCCAGRWLSRLDVYTCHRRIYEPVYYFCALVAHILSLPDKHESTKLVPSELNKRGQVKRTNTGLPNTYHIMKLRNQSEHPIGQNSLLSTFWNRIRPQGMETT